MEGQEVFVWHEHDEYLCVYFGSLRRQSCILVPHKNLHKNTPNMDAKPKLETLESIQDLTSKETRRILECCSDEEKSRVLEFVEQMNQRHAAQIKQNEAKIELEVQISQIFLKKCWRNLSKEEKPGCATFFREIHDKIAGNH